MCHHVLNVCVIQALRKSQKVVGEQAAEIKSLRTEVDSLTYQLEASLANIASTSSKQRIAKLAFDGADQVATLAKKFSMMHEPWVDDSIFDLPRNFKGHPDSKERFATEDSYDQGTLAALYMVIPECFHEHMISKEFRSAVRLYFSFIIDFLALIMLCVVYPRSEHAAFNCGQRYPQRGFRNFWRRGRRGICSALQTQ